MPRKISVIIPVYRESATINPTIGHLRQLNCSDHIEIIVVDGDPSRSTLKAITHPGIKKLTGPKGRSPQMNKGARSATGQILLFLHADTLLPRDGFKRILTATAPQHVVGGAFDLGLDAAGTAYRLIETAVCIRTRLTRIPYGDQAIFIKKQAFHAMGGYPDIPIMEDVAMMRGIKKQGGKIAIIPRPVATSARRWKKEGIVCCTLRNWMLMLLYTAGVPAGKLVRYYP